MVGFMSVESPGKGPLAQKLTCACDWNAMSPCEMSAFDALNTAFDEDNEMDVSRHEEVVPPEVMEAEEEQLRAMYEAEKEKMEAAAADEEGLQSPADSMSTLFRRINGGHIVSSADEAQAEEQAAAEEEETAYYASLQEEDIHEAEKEPLDDVYRQMLCASIWILCISLILAILVHPPA